jgi:formyl-CoA transferase
MKTQDAYEKMVEVEVPAAPVLSLQDVLLDPQIVHNGTIVEAEHPVYGRYRRVRPSARFSETKEDATRPSALYAEHSDEILDELGTSTDERARLRTIGALT